MSLVAMPFLMQNLGSEMIYILDQRLKAQLIPQDKGTRVLHDVARTMYEPTFFAELLRPQETYSHASIRQIFEKLAHSSIMRLSESSMDKLYDLMTMGFKYQLLCCLFPEHLLQITVKHTEGVLTMLSDEDVVKTVTNALELTRVRFSKLSTGDWASLRQTLCSFFQDKRVKVSMFLQEGRQSSDGHMVLPLHSPPQFPNASLGSVRVFDIHGNVTEEDQIPLIYTSLPSLETESLLPLGGNMYEKARSMPATDDRSDTAGATSSPRVVEPRALCGIKGGSGQEESTSMFPPPPDKGHSTQQLNLLAELIAPPRAEGSFFRVNLFDSVSLNLSEKGVQGHGVETLMFGDEARDSRTSEVAAILKSITIDGGNGDAEEEDNLLALMDSAK